MKGITKYLIVVSLVCYSVTGCTEKKGDTFDAEHEKNEIIKMTGERFKRMMATDNPNEIAQIYTENTVEVPVYMPQNDEVLIGKEAIRGWGEKFFGKYRLTVGKPYKGLYDEWLLSPEMAVHRYESRGYFIDRATKDLFFRVKKPLMSSKKKMAFGCILPIHGTPIAMLLSYSIQYVIRSIINTIKKMMFSPKLDAEIYQHVKETAAIFAKNHIKPIAETLDREERFPEALYAAMAKHGLFGITAPEAYGGLGLDVYAYALIMEEISKGYASIADQCGVIELICTLLTTYGTQQQRNLYLRKIISTEIKIAYCITEAEAGSDVSGIKTRAEKTDTGWVLTGSKQWIHNAPIANLGFVLAVTDPKLGHRGMSIFIVDLNTKGVTKGPRDHKMGQCASQIGALFFDEVHVSEDALLGELNKGFYAMMSVLEKGRVGIGALALGIAQAGLEAALDYAQIRTQFGKSIFSNQGIQWLLADMATDISAARLLVHQAALKLDNNVPAGTACSMAKRFASDKAVEHTANAVQIFGGSGYIKGFEVERLYRDAKITQIYEGTNQIQRNIIAKNLEKGLLS